MPNVIRTSGHRKRSPTPSRVPSAIRSGTNCRTEPPGSNGHGRSAAHSPATSLLCQGHDDNATNKKRAPPTTSRGFSPVSASPALSQADVNPGPSRGARSPEYHPFVSSGCDNPSLKKSRKSITESKRTSKEKVVSPSREASRGIKSPRAKHIDASRLRELLDRSVLTPETHATTALTVPLPGDRMTSQCLLWGALATEVLVVALLVLLSRRGSTVCDTEACRHYGKLLAASLNTSVDPCNDFHRFVCSGWESRRYRSVMDTMYEEFIKKVAEKIGRMHVPPEHQTAIQKAAKFFQSCRKIYRERSSDLGAVRALLARAGVLWPEMSTSARLLPTLFWMAAAWNWGAVIEFLTDKPGLFTVRPSLLYFLTLQRRRSMLGSSGQDKYRQYFDKMSNAFRRPNTSVLPFEELMKLERWVVPRLQKSYEAHYFNSLPNASLDQVVLMTEGLTNLSVWREQLASHFNDTLPAGGRYLFTVENREFFSAFFGLVADVGEPQMTYYVGWATVQVMALLSNAELIRYYYLSDAEAYKGHVQFCAGLAHIYMGLSFYAEYIRLEIKEHETRGVTAIVRTIRQSFGKRLRSSPFGKLASGVTWLADATDGSTMNLVKNAQSAETLDALFQEFPNMTNDVLDNIAVATQARRRTPADTTMERFTANQSLRVYYLRSDGHFEFLPTAFEVPLYHMGAPPALNYGALGSEIANAFTELFYHTLLQSDNATLRAFIDNASCVLDVRLPPGAGRSEGFNLQVIQRAASVNVLHRAFTGAVGLAKQLRLKDLDRVDDEQLLFIAWCYTQCGRSDAHNLCNKPLAVLPAFGRAFSCGPGSPLYSEHKCTVLP